MMMPMMVAKWLLFYLHILKSDDLSPQFFLGWDVPGYPSESPSKQQLVVDMIYRCLKCGLVELSPEGWLECAGLSIEDFANELARVDARWRVPDENPESRQHAIDMGVWLEPQLYCTAVGEGLVNRYFPGELDLEDEVGVARFNEEICVIFAAHGFPWATGALIPLKF